MTFAQLNVAPKIIKTGNYVESKNTEQKIKYLKKKEKINLEHFELIFGQNLSKISLSDSRNDSFQSDTKKDFDLKQVQVTQRCIEKRRCQDQ